MGQGSDTLREAFHRSMRLLLGLEMLPISSVILLESKIEGKLTWYAASMQENTISAIGFSCFESGNEHVCFSRMIYRADSLSDFDTISTPSLADPRPLKMGSNSSKFSIVLLNCTSNAVKVEPKAYDRT